MPHAIDDFSLVAETLDAVSTGATAVARDRATALATAIRAAESGGAEAGLAAALDAAAAEVATASDEDLLHLARWLTVRFHLANKVEQITIAGINRERARASTPERPRPESIAEAVGRAVAVAGGGRATMLAHLERLDIQPTLTAHPTETRRRTVLHQQATVAEAIAALRDPSATPSEVDAGRRRLRQAVQLLLVTDVVRSRELGVPDEVRNGLHYLITSIRDTVPQLAEDVLRAVRETWPEPGGPASTDDLPVLVRYRTWIGGDRDGNPKVTHERTREALAAMRVAAVGQVDGELAALWHELSVSDHRIELPAAFAAAIASEARPGDVGDDRFPSREPFRARVAQIRRRLREDAAYDAEALLADLRQVRDALRTAGVAEPADAGPLADLILRVRTFGLHLAALDIRQHARVHAAVVAELLALAGMERDYVSRDEPGRLAILRRELEQPRPLRPPAAELSETAAELLGVLEVVRAAVDREPESVGAWIVSMTHAPSDVFAVLLLLKEVGLLRRRADGSLACDLDIVPLLETVDDLRNGESLLETLYTDPIYRQVLADRGRRTPGVAAPDGDGEPSFQEVMLGYSDSNKDGGFLAANVALQSAQRTLGLVGRRHGVVTRFFHGRGGSVGRGGGRANRAILTAPAPARTGRLRFTEQGEVISFRYAMPEIARRHLEQIVGAVIESSIAGAVTGAEVDEDHDPALADLLDRLAADSMAAYRGLIDHPAFWAWFVAAGPVRSIGGLPIASRPVMRSGRDLNFDNLRAIPWVFSWTQMRSLVPGWFGLGAAIDGLDAGDRARLAAAYAGGTIVRTILDNARREMARARMPIARRYAEAVPGGPAIQAVVEADFALAGAVLVEITGCPGFHEAEPAIARAIDARNPWTDVLNLVQIELLDRVRTGGAERAEQLRPHLHAVINGLAAAMQSTG